LRLSNVNLSSLKLPVVICMERRLLSIKYILLDSMLLHMELLSSLYTILPDGVIIKHLNQLQQI
jgi:hypothetical protein